jgi:NADH dehydrogenase
VLILGGGFAGIGAAKRLNHVSVEVILVDRRDYHTFLPMVYQLATGSVDTDAVAHPLREVFEDQRNASVVRATVEHIAIDERRVHFADMAPLDYDFLVIGLGARVSFLGVKGAAEYAFPLYSVADAVILRQHLVRRWEAANRDRSLVDDGSVNVVVAGGGLTGVETAGALSELYAGTSANNYPSVPTDRGRVILVEAKSELFAKFKPTVRRYASRELERGGVELMLGEVVQQVSPTAVTLGSGTVLDTHTLVWGGGVRPDSVVETLDVALVNGRLPVGPSLQVAEHEEIFAVGDCALIVDSRTGHVLPQLASVALQAGEHAGTSIARRIHGMVMPPKPFAYRDKGTMATLGRGTAVAQLDRGRPLKGAAAWLARGAVHLAHLSADEDRTKAMIDRTWAEFTQDVSDRSVREPALQFADWSGA